MAFEFLLWLRVIIVRFLLSYNDAQERKQEPRPPPPTFTETIPSRSSRGSVRLHFHLPARSSDAKQSKHPLVIDFHGGGFSSGLPSMNDRWIASLLTTATTQPIVVGVDYSLAPEYPFPAAWQDATAAIAYLATDGAIKHNIDPSRIILSGFSAGGTLSLTVPLWMHENQQETISAIPPLRGIISVYPSTDSRLTRAQSSSLLTRFLNATWDLAFTQRSPITSPFISPASASDALLEAALPAAIALYPVANDPLCAPAESFRDRVRQLGKNVTGYVEPDAVHAWDKLPIREGDANEVARRWAKRDMWFTRMAQDVDEMLK